LKFQSSPGLVTGRYPLASKQCGHLAVFQSSPGLVTGRYLKNACLWRQETMFQSSPGLVTGRYRELATKYGVVPWVSILARSGDRALRASKCCGYGQHKFQSSPGLVTGRYVAQKCSCPLLWCFNPRPVW